MTVRLSRRGRMFIEQNQAILERLESLEHCSNQQSLLIEGLLDILEKGMQGSTN